MKRIQKFLNVASTILLVIAVALVVTVFVLRLTGVQPKLFGYYFFNVMSDSMTPMLQVDDVILVKEDDGTHLHKGDVITYHGQSGELAGKDITHQVIEEPVTDAGGTIRIKTKGLKTGAIVDPVITSDQVIGKYVGKLKVVSVIYKIFKTWYGLLIFLAILMALIGKEVYNLMKLSKKADDAAALTQEQIQQILKAAEEKKKAEEKAQEEE